MSDAFIDFQLDGNLEAFKSSGSSLPMDQSPDLVDELDKASNPTQERAGWLLVYLESTNRPFDWEIDSPELKYGYTPEDHAYFDLLGSIDPDIY